MKVYIVIVTAEYGGYPFISEVKCFASKEKAEKYAEEKRPHLETYEYIDLIESDLVESECRA